jgi:hypothetical protein
MKVCYISFISTSIIIANNHKPPLYMMKVLSTQNIGEKDEVQCIKRLFTLNTENRNTELVHIFGNDASEGIDVINASTGIVYNNIEQIKKTTNSYKADVVVRMKKNQKPYNISIKSTTGANPAILNHTHRNAKVFQEGGYLNRHLGHIDSLLNEYKEKRVLRTFKEDVCMPNLECLQNPEIRSSIVNTLAYFLFQGTGRGDSKQQADSILVWNKGIMTFKDCTTTENQRNYADTILKNCVMSLREKGMSRTVKKTMLPWIYEEERDGVLKRKGCWHIRMDKRMKQED